MSRNAGIPYPPFPGPAPYAAHKDWPIGDLPPGFLPGFIGPQPYHAWVSRKGDPKFTGKKGPHSGPEGEIGGDMQKVTRPNRLSLPANEWLQYEAQFPCLLYPLREQTANPECLLAPIIYYPGEGLPTNSAEALRGLHNGCVFLSSPGKWWLRYGGAAKLDCLIFDASDMGVLPYLGLGSSIPSLESRSAIVTNAVHIDVFGPNPYRTGLLLQNVGTTNLRYSLVNAPTPATGLRLTPGNSISLTPPLVTGHYFRVISETAGPGAFEALEFRRDSI